MHESRLLTGIAALFAGMTALLAILGVVYNPLILVVAAFFAGITYLLWMHGTGRLAARLYERVEQQAAANAGGTRRRRRVRGDRSRDAERGGFGAGPREEWRGPRAEQRARQRQARNGRQRQRTAPSTSDRLSAAEAYETLGLEPGADESAIKSAYREKVKDVHPDTDGGDEEAFKAVNRAYERLSGE